MNDPLTSLTDLSSSDHEDIILNRCNNVVFLFAKIYRNRCVYDLICASEIWMKPETLRHQVPLSKF